ncbi:MAG: hypothetical protein BWK78_08395 [Thiotrichaceae bacterium IS1]|nr:MAG: hypothetical protein BWK78_08395 [Thiotrichaceae bacterium IS1]
MVGNQNPLPYTGFYTYYHRKNRHQKSPSLSIFQTLTFLKQHTGQEETQLVGQALLLGLQLLYRQTVEQAFIEETLPRNEAINLLGAERVADLEYAKQALWRYSPSLGVT